jgi:hypothetical protein
LLPGWRVAGASSEAVVYPFEVVRRKIQLQSMAQAAEVAAGHAVPAVAVGNRLAQLGTMVTGIAKQGGVRAFYSGVVPNVLQVRTQPEAAYRLLTCPCARASVCAPLCPVLLLPCVLDSMACAWLSTCVEAGRACCACVHAYLRTCRAVRVCHSRHCCMRMVVIPLLPARRLAVCSSQVLPSSALSYWTFETMRQLLAGAAAASNAGAV